MVRVEEVVKGKAETSHSNYVSGRSVSLNQYVGSAEDPANLEDEGYYSISVHLRLFRFRAVLWWLFFFFYASGCSFVLVLLSKKLTISPLPSQMHKIIKTQ